MYSNEDIEKLRTDFLNKTKALREQIDNKKAKIEKDQQTLRNHQKKLDTQVQSYENEVNALITKLVLKDGIDKNKVQEIYNFLMNFNQSDEQPTVKHSESDKSEEVHTSSTNHVSQETSYVRSDNQNYHTQQWWFWLGFITIIRSPTQDNSYTHLDCKILVWPKGIEGKEERFPRKLLKTNFEEM